MPCTRSGWRWAASAGRPPGPDNYDSKDKAPKLFLDPVTGRVNTFEGPR
jgi:hypothetical protein